jgi:hypothetical protein
VCFFKCNLYRYIELCCGAKNGLTAEGKGHIAVIAAATMAPV